MEMSWTCAEAIVAAETFASDVTTKGRRHNTQMSAKYQFSLPEEEFYRNLELQ